MSHKELFSYQVDADGIGLLTIDQQGKSTNLFSLEFVEAFIEQAQQVIADADVKGLIITSGKKMFMPGADLNELRNMGSNPQEILDKLMQMHRSFREIETAGKPFVAAINGTAMGGGLELSLLCHHRIVIDDPKIKLGLPESKVGLLPGGGGTVKLPYLLGIQNALIYLLQGIEARPQKALKDGLVGELATDQEDLIAKAKAWILANPRAFQPWDNKKHKIPGGGLMTPNGFQTMAGAIGNLRKMTHGNYPAHNSIMSIIHDSLTLNMDRAVEIEARYFTHILGTPEAKNMIRTGFVEMQKARKGKARPQDQPPYEVKKVGILGAGMMGAGIAFVSAKVGMEVVLKDVSEEKAEKGKDYSRKILEKRIKKGFYTQEKADAILNRIQPTADPQAVAGCDLVIEAVFEDPGLKARVTQETEAVLEADKIFGSNTSTIPITQLAQASDRPENFIGIHFFSPVDKMPLVEIIVGEKTGDRAIAAAVDYSVAIGKIPIVVNDSRGFFTSRCFGMFCQEGAFLLEEGVPAAMVENIAKNQGMPVGPLAVTDEVTLTLGTHVYESYPEELKTGINKRFYELERRMIEEFGRPGKSSGKGFYDYPEKGKKKLWPELSSIFQTDPKTYDRDFIARRIMHRQALESFRCLEEGVLHTASDGDIGSVLGWGFPIYTGGSLSYIDYVGIQQFVEDCDAFAERFGEHWQVPDSLRSLAKAGKSVHAYQPS
jgi:3-hydroxyacyl-CoA dehydrogenase/enoyl-CoA hydratase/3-hydroxybutyryl-CoA epimerase